MSRENIINGKTALGIEFGSTRIKAVLIDEKHSVLASGGYEWENKFENGFWTYSESDIIKGMQSCYRDLADKIFNEYGVVLSNIGSIGISAMMHGYLVLDKQDNLLVPFRTWRNNNAENAAKELTELFNYNIPARWSIAHLYQAVKNKEPHIKDIAFQTTLEGYIHYLLTNEKVIGIGEASGMFPIDIKTKQYDVRMVKSFEDLPEVKENSIRLNQIFPEVLLAGEKAGTLTETGAKLLDPSGNLKEGIPFCPPEGDAGTGMVATNSVRPKTGNISAGTSIFGMIVLEKELGKVYPEIDLVTTPSGELVAMVHCNNCSSEINAWMNIFSEVTETLGLQIDKSELFSKLFNKSLKGEKDCGGLLGYNYVSGENITGIDEGRPMFMRTTDSKFNLANFMRMQIYSAFATLKIGLDILTAEEKMKINSILAHGGIFKTKGVAQRFLAAAINAPVSANQTSNEGGPFGMAVLAMYSLNGGGKTLEDYLDKVVFKNDSLETVEPDALDVQGFNSFMNRYIEGLLVVKLAVTALKE